MATQAVKTRILEGVGPSMAFKVGLVNLAACSTGVAVLVATRFQAAVAVGFAFGYLLGVVNIFWLSRIINKAARMEVEKAARYATGNYYIRFMVTALVFVVIIVLGILRPGPLLAGFAVSIFITMAAMSYLITKGATG
jgi:hypothetical protein